MLGPVAFAVSWQYTPFTTVLVMTLSQMSWLSLVIQLVLVANTAIIMPVLLRPLWTGYFIYLASVGGLWFIYTVAAMFFNDKAGIDVPGVGYLLIGFIAWVFGSAIYLYRIIRHKNEPIPKAAGD